MAVQMSDKPPIRRKPEVVEGHKDWTEDRDVMADYIEEMWPAPLREIAKEAGYSRQHAKNTLDAFFEEAPEYDFAIPKIPDDVERRSYIRGYLDGIEK